MNRKSRILDILVKTGNEPTPWQIAELDNKHEGVTLLAYARLLDDFYLGTTQNTRELALKYDNKGASHDWQEWKDGYIAFYNTYSKEINGEL